MAEKEFRARQTQKTDTAENWAKATGFKPKKGEIIVYQEKNETTSKIKIGDGEHYVEELGFSGGNGNADGNIINDNLVSQNSTWSSFGIADRMCAMIDEEGKFASCKPLEGFPLQIQSVDAEGNDRTEAKIVVCGKNLHDGGTYPLEDSGYIIHSSGETSEASTSGYAFTAEYIPVSHLASKFISITDAPVTTNGASTKAGIAFYNAEKVFLTNKGSIGTTVQVPANAAYARFTINKNYLRNSAGQMYQDVKGKVTSWTNSLETERKNEGYVYAQIEIGEMVTSYEPYQEEEHDIEDMPQTVVQKEGINNIFIRNNTSKDIFYHFNITGATSPKWEIDFLKEQIFLLRQAIIAAGVSV